jgi:hypothetical protein
MLKNLGTFQTLTASSLPTKQKGIILQITDDRLVCTEVQCADPMRNVNCVSHWKGCTKRVNNYLSDKFRTNKPGALAEEVFGSRTADFVNLKKPFVHSFILFYSRSLHLTVQPPDIE